MRSFIICLSVLSLTTEVFSRGCNLPVVVGDEQRMPILVDNSTYELVFPRQGKVNLDAHDRIILLCPNKKNTIAQTNTSSAAVSCVRDTTIKVLTKNVGNIDFNEVSCTAGVRGDALTTRKKCGGGFGYIIDLGFPAGKQFLTLIEVCYDGENGNTFYSSHTLVGGELGSASKSSYRPTFSTAELGSGVSASVAYKQAYQKASFNKLLGSAKLAEKYINGKSYLARGHLAPHADFLFATWKIATYFYVNVVPQWQAINNGNWKVLEGVARAAASYYKEDLQVYTGVHKILALPNTRNVSTNIYLVSSKKLAVPKFLWKILHSEKSGNAIAFVSLNNPFVTKLVTSDKLCTNICDRYGWDQPAWNTGSKGFIYCCDARDLLGVIPTGPSLKIKGVLKAPEVFSRFNQYEYTTYSTEFESTY